MLFAPHLFISDEGRLFSFIVVCLCGVCLACVFAHRACNGRSAFSFRVFCGLACALRYSADDSIHGDVLLRACGDGLHGHIH